MKFNNEDRLAILNHFQDPQRAVRDLRRFFADPNGRNGIHFLDWFVLWERFQSIGSDGRNFFDFVEDWRNAEMLADPERFHIYPSYQRQYEKRLRPNHLSMLRDLFSLYEKMPFHFPPGHMVAILKIIRQRDPSLTAVFDPCAGWGGRLLGCAWMGLDYTGTDTNANLIEPYRYMIQTIQSIRETDATFIHADCMTIDLEAYKPLRCIITSPPYFNFEKYRGMTLRTKHEWREWYRRFFLRFFDALEPGGHLALNVPTSIFEIFREIREPVAVYPFSIVKRTTTDYQEFFYIWIK